MLDTRHQPALESLVKRLSGEINAKAVMLIHENGQVLHRHGNIGEHEYPAMAALVAGMIAVGKSLGSLGETFAGAPNRFACDSEAVGLYMSFVSDGIWLTALYDQPLNPGLFRMKVRRYAETAARLSASRPSEWELPVQSAPEMARAQASAPAPIPAAPVPQNGTVSTVARAASTPVANSAPTHPEKVTEQKKELFNNITDEEIDLLFDGASSTELKLQ